MNEGSGRKRARGRPALPAGEGKLYAVGFRTTKEVKEFLEQMADSSGRSLAQEIERRLLESFNFEGMLGGQRAAAFFRKLAERVELVTKDESWLDDCRTYRTVRAALVQAIDSMEPPGTFGTNVLDGLRSADPVMRRAARGFAEALVKDPALADDIRAQLAAELEKEEL